MPLYEYTCKDCSIDFETLVFTSEAIINIPKGWKARETYRVLGINEFEETFELAPPEKEFAQYTRVRFKRQ